MNLLTENGMNVFGFSADWNVLEPSPATFNLHDQFIAPLTLLVPQYPEIDGVVFVLKMIASLMRKSKALTQMPFVTSWKVWACDATTRANHARHGVSLCRAYNF